MFHRKSFIRSLLFSAVLITGILNLTNARDSTITSAKQLSAQVNEEIAQLESQLSPRERQIEQLESQLNPRLAQERARLRAQEIARIRQTEERVRQGLAKLNELDQRLEQLLARIDKHDKDLVDLVEKIFRPKDLHVTLAAQLATIGLNKYVQQTSISPAKKKFVRRFNWATNLHSIAVGYLFFFPPKDYEPSINYKKTCQKYITVSSTFLCLQYGLDLLPERVQNSRPIRWFHIK